MSTDAGNLPEIERLEAVALQPGDVLIAHVPAATSAVQAHELRRFLGDAFPAREIRVLSGDIELEVFRDKEH